MSKIILILAVILTCAFSADPTRILIKNDTNVGTYIQDAVAELWPDCYCRIYTYEIPAFIIALRREEWDIVVWDGFMQRSLNTSDYDVMEDWYVENKALLFDDWGIRYGISSPSINLTNAMGVTYSGSFYNTIVSHYCWEPGHPYSTGIDNWNIEDRGLPRELWGLDMSWMGAHPVTGWLESPYSGYGALFEAENGVGCVSGMFWYSMTENKALMKNILSYAWAGIENLKISQTTLGNIKAAYK